MKTYLLYLLNKLIGRGEKFLLETMIRCETDQLFNHKLEMSSFWELNFPYSFINALKADALSEIIRREEKQISRLSKLLTEKKSI